MMLSTIHVIVGDSEVSLGIGHLLGPLQEATEMGPQPSFAVWVKDVVGTLRSCSNHFFLLPCVNGIRNQNVM